MPHRSLTIDCDHVVVYEADEISPASVAMAVKHLDGDGAVHFASDDAVYPANGGLVWRTYPSKRSGEFRDHAIERLRTVLENARKSSHVAEALSVDGVDVAEVALIDWAYRSGDAVLKEWIYRRIVAAGVRSILWIPGEAKYAREHAIAAGSFFRKRGIAFACLPTGGAGSAGALHVLRVKNEIAAALQFLRGVAAASTVRALATPTSDRPRVLFAENYPKTAKIAAAAAKELETAGDVDVWFMVTRPDTEAMLRPFGLSRLLLLDRFVSKPAWSRSFSAQRRVVRAARRLRADSDDELVGPQLVLSATAQWRYAAHMTTLWHDALTRIRPHVIATTSQANIFARAAVAVGHRLGATSFFIQHGLLGHDRFESHVMADRQLLWGEWDRQRRIELGFRPDSLSVTGSPTIQAELLSREATEDPWSPGAAVKVLYLPSLTTGQWISPSNATRQRDAVLSAVRDIDGAELVLKVHPADRSGIFAVNGIRVLRDGMAAPLIRHADVVIVSTSTSGLEACALDKAVIVMRGDGVRVFRQYEDHGAVLFATDENSLREHLVSLRDDAALRSELQHRRCRMNDELFDGLRPGACGRIAEALKRGALERAGHQRYQTEVAV